MYISGMLYVNVTHIDRHIKRHFGIPAEIVLKFSSTVMMLRSGYDTVIQLRLFEAVK